MIHALIPPHLGTLGYQTASSGRICRRERVGSADRAGRRDRYH